eukprot:3290606-Pleurochrysis_carterae.AAC.1
MDGCGDCMSACCATKGRLKRVVCDTNVPVMRSTSGNTDSSNLTSLKPTVDKVAAAALVDAEVNTFCNTRCEYAELLCFAAK